MAAINPDLQCTAVSATVPVIHNLHQGSSNKRENPSAIEILTAQK